MGGAAGSHPGRRGGVGPASGREEAQTPVAPNLQRRGGEASLKQWWKRGRRAPSRASPMAAPRAQDQAGDTAIR